MPDWLQALIKEVLTDILTAELTKHGVISPAPKA